ncbi:MAG: DNA primase [Candidatus Pacebacteria bacterium]|nr:DNA primase [Candidatus Paceibacterota bacterium]
MSSDIEEIKSRLNIVDVVGAYIKLEKAGINYRARCPFHSEKSASFFVSPSRQLWHCFGGCNEGGDVFKFVMKIEGIEFVDALKILADKAGVQLKKGSADYEKMKSERQVLLDLSERATKFFSAQLKSGTGTEVLDYLKKRGLTEETIRDWRIGYAPNSWQSLSDYLIGQGFAREAIVSAGLAIRKDPQKFFDRFRSRIMFPICDFNSAVIGFTGRVFKSEEESKYMNVPNTLLYDKSRALYGMDKAKMEIRQKDFCVLVEGNVDCIMSHQAGVKNCIAVSGTALTPIHLGIIKRYTSNLVLAFDMDLAGNKATSKGIDMALKSGFNVKVISMVAEKDPADIVLIEGPEKWASLVNEAKPINRFYFDLAFKNRDPELFEDKKKIVSDLLPVFKKIDNNIEQSYWIEELGNRLKIKEEDIRKEMQKVRMEAVYAEEARAVEKEKKTRWEMLEEVMLAIALINPSLVSGLDISSFSPRIAKILGRIKENPSIKTEELLDGSIDDNFLNYMLIKSELLKDSEIELDKEFKKCLDEIERLSLKEERERLVDEIKIKEREGGEVSELLSKFNKLIKNNEEEAPKEGFEEKASETEEKGPEEESSEKEGD